MESHNVLIVVEGETDKNFFRCLSKQLGYDDQIWVEYRGGKGAALLERFLKQDLSRFTQCSRMLIINDDDGAPDASADSIEETLKRSRKDPNVEKILSQAKVEVLLIPDNLEVLLLKTCKYQELISCIEEFVTCIKSKNLKGIPKKEVKTRFFTYLAAMKEPTDKDHPFVYEQFFDLEHKELQFIKDKIIGFFK